MATYLLNGMVEFNDETHSLKNKETDDVILLSFTSSGILSFLVSHKGDVISRNEIFDKIFDRNGVQTTNNNLNQYISALRKNIKSIGIEDDVIITVPRAGFMLNREIMVQQVTLSEEGHTVYKKTPFNIKNSLIFTFMFIALLISVCSVIYLLSILAHDVKISSLPERVSDKTIKINTCAFNIVGRENLISDVQYEEIIKAHFDEKEIQCPSGEYYYVFRNGSTKSRYQQFFMKCTGDANRPVYCTGVYEHFSGLNK